MTMIISISRGPTAGSNSKLNGIHNILTIAILCNGHHRRQDGCQDEHQH